MSHAETLDSQPLQDTNVYCFKAHTGTHSNYNSLITKLWSKSVDDLLNADNQCVLILGVSVQLGTLSSS